MRNTNRVLLASVMGLAFGLVTNHAKAVTSYYYDDNGTTAGYGITSGDSWDASNWSSTSGGTTATTPWGAGGFARFYGGTSGSTYVITVGQDESMAGLFQDATGVSLVINQAASTSGDLDVVSGVQGFLIDTTNASVTINCPIVGPGGVEQEVNGSLALYGTNTYQGGTVTTGGQTLYYNNNSSFGATTGSITIGGSSGQAFINTGPAGVTIANPVIFSTASSGGWNLQGGPASGSTPGTIFSGSVTLPSTGTTTINTSSITTTVDEISGAIGGTSSLDIADDGTMILAGANTYNGTTTVTGPATLKLAASGTIASSSEVILAGGTLNPGGLNQAMSATTLGTTAASTIDFGGAASEIDFANSATASWTGTLNLANWNPAVDELRFGTDSTGLTTAQLADIEFNGAGAGTATLNANGYVVVPEPASLSLLALAAMPLLRRRRA